MSIRVPAWVLAALVACLGAQTAEAKNCRKGKPCGNACIAAWKTCHVGGGSGYRSSPTAVRKGKQRRKEPRAAPYVHIDIPDEPEPEFYVEPGQRWRLFNRAVVCKTKDTLAAYIRSTSNPAFGAVEFLKQSKACAWTKQSVDLRELDTVEQRYVWRVKQGKTEAWVLENHLHTQQRGRTSAR